MTSKRQQSPVDSQLGRTLIDAYINDLNVQRSDTARASLPTNLPAEPLIYTAFDGDHFALVPLMRRHVLSQGAVPVNPESVIGYKDAVDAYHDKAGVLRADLAVLDRCDELWIYTDLPPTISGVKKLAEGVVTELLWFVRAANLRNTRAKVAFVPLHELTNPSHTSRLPWYVYVNGLCLESELSSEFPELLNLVSDVTRKRLPEVKLYIHDPLDSKYANWLRSYSYEMGWIPIVPSLAIQLGDACGDDTLAAVLKGWVQLARVADECWLLPSVDGRAESRFVSIMQAASRQWGKNTFVRDWSEFNVPKIKFGSDWPLTRREGRGKPYAL